MAKLLLNVRFTIVEQLLKIVEWLLKGFWTILNNFWTIDEWLLHDF